VLGGRNAGKKVGQGRPEKIVDLGGGGEVGGSGIKGETMEDKQPLHLYWKGLGLS